MGSSSQPSAPSVPAFNFEKAQEIVQEAYGKQKETTAALEEKSKAYKAELSEAQQDLAKTFGKTPAERLTEYEQNFATQIPALTAQYKAEQSGFKPGILGGGPDSSANLLANALRGAAGEYTQGMAKASDAASSRLYQSLAAPVAGFEQIWNRPSINKLYDPVYMAMAGKPPTVTSDVDSMKGLYTYNV